MFQVKTRKIKSNHRRVDPEYGCQSANVGAPKAALSTSPPVFLVVVILYLKAARRILYAFRDHSQRGDEIIYFEKGSTRSSNIFLARHLSSSLNMATELDGNFQTCQV